MVVVQADPDSSSMEQHLLRYMAGTDFANGMIKIALPTSGLLWNQMRQVQMRKNLETLGACTCGRAHLLFWWLLGSNFISWPSSQPTQTPPSAQRHSLPVAPPTVSLLSLLMCQNVHLPDLLISGDWHTWRIFLLRFREGQVEIFKGRESLGPPLKIIGFSTLAVH